MRSYIISKNDAGQRIDKFLTKTLPSLPQAMLYKYIRIKRIKRNGKRCEASDRLMDGDLLELYIGDEFFTNRSETIPFPKAPPKLNIIYQDENIMLVDKKPGLTVHEDESERFDTLINRIKHYLYLNGEYDPVKENSFTPALCNRIDRNTGGIVIVAKNAASLRLINQKIKQREVRKFYLCLVHGKLQKKSDILQGYLIKDSEKKQVSIYKKPVNNAKTILTKYRVISEGEKYSLLEVELLTGRTHQIRAHLAFIGHPLAGDTKYGRKKDNDYKYQALYSYKVVLDFTTDSGHLEYLRGMEFSVPRVPFADKPRA